MQFSRATPGSNGSSGGRARRDAPEHFSEGPGHVGRFRFVSPGMHLTLVLPLQCSDRMEQRRCGRPLSRRFEDLSAAVTRWTGSTAAFGSAVCIVVVWSLLGPVFHFSTTWQLVINTGTTIVTFLMVFLIQRTQNKDALAIHLKLNEIVAALDGASNRLIDVEAMSEEDLRTLECHYGELAELARKDRDLAHSHSVEEARERHSIKQQPRR
jgi:low affinity Fe/Cu permease